MKIILKRLGVGVCVFTSGFLLFTIHPFICAWVTGPACVLEILLALKDYDKYDKVLLVSASILYIVLTCSSYVLLCKAHWSYACYAIIASALSDMTAYLFGYFINRTCNKLKHNKASIVYPLFKFLNKRPIRVSPNKTIGGFIGAAISGVFLIQLWYPLRKVLDQSGYYMIPALSVPIGILLGLFSQVGDLIESTLKRRVGLKDMGLLFGMHGGICDRADSILGASLSMYVLIFLLNFK